MTIENKLNKVIETKSDIKQAIEEKGQTVGESLPFAQYADKIRNIETGGSSGEGCSPEEKIEVAQGIFGDESCVLAIDGYNCTNGGYTGSSKCVVIPDSFIKLYFNMSDVKKVIIMHNKMTDMSEMFSDSQATELDLNSFDTSNVTEMSYMFAVSQAAELDLSSFDTSNVTGMSSMFYSSLATSLDLSSFDTSNVTDMSYMFMDSRATSLDLSSFDTSNVTGMISMFSSSQATSLDLSSFDTSNVTDMNEMFYNSQATELDLSSFDTSNVTVMYNMFDGAAASVIYARTEEDAERFRDQNPNGIPVVVKSNLSTKSTKLSSIQLESHNEFDNEDVRFVGYKDKGDYLEAVYAFKFSDDKKLENLEDFEENAKIPSVSLLPSPSLKETKASTIKLKLPEDLEVNNDLLKIEVTSDNKLVNLHGNYNELEINSINESRGLLKVAISKDSIEL